jgi:hypothetical protein
MTRINWDKAKSPKAFLKGKRKVYTKLISANKFKTLFPQTFELNKKKIKPSVQDKALPVVENLQEWGRPKGSPEGKTTVALTEIISVP